MKLGNAVETQNIVSDGLEEKTFNILANDKMFNILSSKIYTDKITAPIRELSCNAYDANVAAGRKDTPIEVHIPTEQEPWFEVCDQGRGMTPQEMEELYTTYGASSKTSSNRFVGCLGLGSKSPFAYTDRFSVVSVKHGVKCQYECYLENNVPKVVKFSEEKTGESSGTRVRFSVGSDVIWKFQNKASTFYSNFFPTPVFNIPLELKPYDMASGIAATDSYSRYVLMGNVLYEYNIYDFRRDYPSFYEQFKDCNTVIAANIGDVDISVSRENVEMTRKSMDFISRKNLEYARNIQSDFEKKKDTYKSTFAYLVAYKELLDKYRFISRKSFNAELAMYRIDVPDAVSEEDDILKIRGGSDLKREWRGVEHGITFALPDISAGTRFFTSTGRRPHSNAAIDYWLKYHSERLAFIVSSKKTQDALEQAGIHIETLVPDPATRTSTGGSSQVMQEGKYDGYYSLRREGSKPLHCGFSKFSQQEQLAAVKSGEDAVYYILMDRLSAVEEETDKIFNAFSTYNISDAFMDFVQILKDSGRIVVGLNRHRYSRLVKSGRLINIVDEFCRMFCKNSDIYKEYYRVLMRESLEDSIYMNFFRYEFSPSAFDMFPAARDLYMDLKNAAVSDGNSVYGPILKQLYRYNTDYSAYTDTARQLRECFYTRYPMTRNVYMDARRIQEYISMVDRLHELEAMVANLSGKSESAS